MHRLDEVEIYCVLRPANWGKGIGPEVCSSLIANAFASLGVERVVGAMHPENKKSIEMAHRLGFEQVGVYECPVRGWQHGHIIVALSQKRYNYVLNRTVGDRFR